MEYMIHYFASKMIWGNFLIKYLMVVSYFAKMRSFVGWYSELKHEKQEKGLYKSGRNDQIKPQFTSSICTPNINSVNSKNSINVGGGRNDEG
ncbi:hypothetical protein JOC95_001607 [Bacillus tianshenii]|uniref:Uncharacterized protein n=2 Tax=Sutcliffiella tianshenii TaxID=1463404 RepID=A0ABS2NYM5_9BACI|nr:hypothetical protein [Bacillus tianshenii]